MRGIKVRGMSSMSRQTSVPGAITSTDTVAAMAAFEARKAQENRDNLLVTQQQQIEHLQTQLEVLMKHVGVASVVQPATDAEASQ